MGDLRSELLAIREKRGLLTGRIVYEEAKKRNHPLHDKVFDVPPGEAAERYYINRATNLLRVTFRTDVGGRPADLRSFVVVKGTEEEPRSQYVPIEEVAQSPIATQLVLQQMRRDWQRFRARYELHQEFMRELIRGDIEFDDDLGPDDPIEPSNGTEG